MLRDLKGVWESATSTSEQNIPCSRVEYACMGHVVRTKKVQAGGVKDGRRTRDGAEVAGAIQGQPGSRWLRLSVGSL